MLLNSANPRYPAYSVVFTPKFEREFLNSPRTIPPFGLRMKPHIQAAGINTTLIAEQTVSKKPKVAFRKTGHQSCPLLILEKHHYS